MYRYTLSTMARRHTRRTNLHTAAAAAALGGALCAAVLALAAMLPAGAAAAPQNLAALQAQAARVSAEVARLDRHAEVSIEKYDIARSELDQLNVNLISARRDLMRAQTALDIAQAQLGERLSQIYKSGDVGLLDVLVNADDLTEVSTQLGYVRLISQADDHTVDGVRALTREVTAYTAGIEADRAAALVKEKDLRAKQTDIEDQLAQRRALLADLDTRVKALVERQAHAGGSRAGADIGSINGTAAQVAVVKETMKYLGIPYVWAGATPSGGFDCSGLVLYVYAKFGVDFPHGATMQARMGTPVPFSQLEPADLVFFGSPAFYHHVGIYIGGGRFIEAPHTGDVVKISVLAGRGATLACRYPIRVR
jgi:cell wall-associated NlpC family hydrolase